MNQDSARQAQIVRYWRAVEYFSPPKAEPLSQEKGVRRVERGRMLPWEPGVLDAPGKHNVWRHTVYAGTFEIRRVRELLHNVHHFPIK